MVTVRLWGRARFWAPPALVLGVAVAAVSYVAAVDPSRPGHYPTCPFLAITGYYCPGCGSLRMVHALAHGHVAEAFGRNPLAFAVLPFVTYLWGHWTLSAVTGRPVRSKIVHPAVIIVFAVVSLVYWVVRNLPVGRALAP